MLACFIPPFITKSLLVHRLCERGPPSFGNFGWANMRTSSTWLPWMEGCKHRGMEHPCLQKPSILVGFPRRHWRESRHDSPLIEPPFRSDAFRKETPTRARWMHTQVFTNVFILEPAVEQQWWCHQRPARHHNRPRFDEQRNPHTTLIVITPPHSRQNSSHSPWFLPIPIRVLGPQWQLLYNKQGSAF